jgi:O-Antigen ligase
MSSALYPLERNYWVAPLLLGVWAAAIAVAPGLLMKLVMAAPAVLVPMAFWTLEAPGRWIGCFLAAAVLLPPLPIALGDSGPHVCLYFAALGLFAGALRLHEWRIPLSGLNGALVAFWTILLASVASAAVFSDAALAGGSLVRVALLGIAVYVFFFTAYGSAISEPIGAIRALYWAAAISALFACVDFYFQFPAPAGYGPQFVWLPSGVYRRAQGVFYEASTLGNFCAFFLVMIAVCASRPRAQTPVSRKALAAGGAVFSTALVLSYSRSSLLNVLTALVVLVWLKRKRIRLARVTGILTLSAAAAVVITGQLFPEFLEAYSVRLSTSAQYLTSATESVFSGRIASWQVLVDWIAAHPWQTLVGIGYKTLPYTTYLGAPVIGDNMYLSLLVETGVLGLAALVWLNVAILRSAARASRAGDSRVSLCGTWILCFWAGQMVQMLSGDLLTYWRVLPVYFWVLALAVRS